MSVFVSGLVLAGGASRRMGRDKRVLAVGRRPLLGRAIDAVAAVCDDLLVVTSPQRPLGDTHGATEVVDRRADAGPLAGLEAGLAAAQHELVVVLAGDHPAAAPAVLADLVARLHRRADLDAVVLGTERGPQPLVAAYRRSVGGVAGELLDHGERRARALLQCLHIEVVPATRWRRLDPAGVTAIDLDTPRDVAAWERATGPSGAAVPEETA